MPIIEKIKTFFAKSIRVWHILRKPDMQEFKSIAKIAAIGILAIGLLGFIISVAMNIF